MQFFNAKLKKPLQKVQVITLVLLFILVCVRISTGSTALDALTLLMVRFQHKFHEMILQCSLTVPGQTVSCFPPLFF